MASHASAGELQWRKAGPKHFKPSADSQPIKPQTAAKPAPRHDGAVRAVAFEAEGRAEFDGPALTARQAGGTESLNTESHSVVVEREVPHVGQQRGVVRSAQLEFEQDGRYNEQITEPFGQPPTEEATEVDLFEQEEMTLPPDAESAPPAEMNRQPRTFQPAPPRNAPRPDPFVESDVQPGDGLPNTEDPTLADEGANAQTDCATELAALKAHTLDQVNLSIAIAGSPGQDFPVECSIDEGQWYEGRCWNETTYMWKASALCHKPLYFEDEALERYGHSWGPCLDPVVSGAHFFCKLPVLPYCMGVHPPNECMYALGHYRPGNCAPYMIPPVPLSCRGAVLQAGAVVGAAAILP